MFDEELSLTQSPSQSVPTVPESLSKFVDPPVVYQRRPRPSPSAVTASDGTTPVSLPSTSTVVCKSLVALAVPKSVGEALKDCGWLLAMHEEKQALKENETWTLGPLRAGKQPASYRWVYSIKYKPDGAVDRLKARLVAKGYSQTEGVDFHETFSPVAKLNSVCVLISLAAHFDWEARCEECILAW